MASGARITLTSPDPSSDIASQHIEHEHMIFSESDSDAVTFNAHDNEMATPDDASSSVSSNSIEIDAEALKHSHPQKVKITIDSVAPYELDYDDDGDVNDEIQSTHRADNIEESEMNKNEQANTLNDGKSEKHVKNDEL